MTECANCDTAFAGSGLCPDCLRELGIKEDTAEHMGLMDPSGESDPSAAADGLGEDEAAPG